MTTQYIDFTTKPGFATLWDSCAVAPADALPISTAELKLLVTPSTRFAIDTSTPAIPLIIDTVEGWEVAEACVHTDFAEGTSLQLAQHIVDSLNMNLAAVETLHFDMSPEALSED